MNIRDIYIYICISMELIRVSIIEGLIRQERKRVLIRSPFAIKFPRIDVTEISFGNFISFTPVSFLAPVFVDSYYVFLARRIVFAKLTFPSAEGTKRNQEGKINRPYPFNAVCQQGQATLSAPVPAFITFQYSEVGLIVLRIQKEGEKEREREIGICRKCFLDNLL